MSTLPQRLAAIGTVILTTAIVAVLVSRALGLPIGVGPPAIPTPIASSPTPVPGSPAASQGPLEVFAQIEADVRALRGLPAADIGPAEILSRAELAGELRKTFDEAWTPEELARDNLTMRALGLLRQDQDLRTLTEQLYAGQVLGFYQFDEKRMVIVSDEGLTPEAQVTYAHEYTHALQDAAFDTGAAHDAQVGQDDEALARLSLEEGDASLVMVLWAIDHLTTQQQLGISQTPVPDMTGIPDWMVAQLEFPYVSGTAFVSQRWASAGFDAVDAVYTDPPLSTEQVIHPEKYRDGEVPSQAEAPDLAAGLTTRTGMAWTVVEETTVGEAMIGIWLQGLGLGDQEATDASAGWGGDSLVVARNASGAWSLAWRISWDSSDDAAEFAAAYEPITADPSSATRVLRTAADEILVVRASSPELVEDTLAASGE